MRNGSDFMSMFSQPPAVPSAEEAQSTWLAAFKGAEPAVKAVARTNLEWVRFASKRAQAAIAVPTRLASCRTPHDLMTEQVRFWQTAVEQYAETTRAVAAVWSNINPMAQMMAHHFESWQHQNAAQKASAAAPTHDLITFPEPKAPAAEARPANREERRLANGIAA
jgi:predicted DNA-binding WGR domain protein